MNDQIQNDLIHASFFFVDIVGLSNPILSTETQRMKIKILNESIFDCKTFISTPKEELFVLPTGDGMLIGFKNGAEQPIKLAIELHEKLRNYNDKIPHTEKITTRIGCNVGHVFVVEGIFGNVNLWGPGTILARRVMDLGNDNHILLTASMADDLFELSDYYKKILHPLHDFKIKHNEEILVYSAYSSDFGNRNPPKNAENGKVILDSLSISQNIICEKMIFNLKLQDPLKNLVKQEQILYFSNNSDEPIYEINVRIITNLEKEFQDVDIKIFDEENDELKISRILSIPPSSKEIVIRLNKPLFKGDSNRFIEIIYNTKQCPRFFENHFLTDTRIFELNFIYPRNATNLAPKLYHIDFNNKKKLIDIHNEKLIQSSKIITWQINNEINFKESIRTEW